MPTFHRLDELLQPDCAGPYVSIYQPTHRQHPDNKQDPILFRNLLKRVEETLRASQSPELVERLTAPLHALVGDTVFWNHTLDGIGVFSADGFFRIMHLQRPTMSLAVVADSFHVKPLLRLVQSADRFQVLCITRHSVRLLEGNRDGLDEVDLHAEVPRSPTDVIGEDLPEPVTRIRSVPGVGSGPGTASVQHGHGAKSDVVDQQTERFFRAVDREIARHHPTPSGQSLVLAGLSENQALFRAVSQSSQLVDKGIEANPEALSVNDMRIQAWKLIERHYLQRLQGFVDQFHAARNVQRASADLSDIAVATVAGRVKVLFVEADRYIAGHVDPDTGIVQLAQAESLLGDDVLDDIAERVLRAGGEVIMIPVERMPVDTGLAAIYRF